MSTLGNGSGTRGPSGSWSNSMKTRFQISSQRGHCSEWSGDAVRALGEVGAAVVVDLAARPAGAGLGHPPEVLVVAGVDVAPAGHPLGRQADLVAPDRPGDLVVRVGRRRQALGRDPELLRQELPGPVDRLALEVVAEAPVPHHLEEGVVARRAPDLLEVVVLAGHPQAALDVDGPGVAARLGAGEDLLELDHPGVREEEGLVAGRDRGSRSARSRGRARRRTRGSAAGSRRRAGCPGASGASRGSTSG